MKVTKAKVKTKVQLKLNKPHKLSEFELLVADLVGRFHFNKQVFRGKQEQGPT